MTRLAWYAVRFIGLAQHYICLLILMFYHPNPCRRGEYEDFMTLYSGVYGGLFLFNANSPDDVPDAVRARLLLVGRVLIFLVFLDILWRVLE